MAATETIQVRMTPEELAELDRIRGVETRAALVKALVRGAVAARDRAQRSCELFVFYDGEWQR